MVQDLRGKQNLGDFHTVPGESLSVLGHEKGLAYGGTGLSHLHIGELLSDGKAAGAHSDGTRGDDEHLSAGAAKLDDLADDSGNVGRIDLDRAGFGQDIGADLDDYLFDVLEIAHCHTSYRICQHKIIRHPYRFFNTASKGVASTGHGITIRWVEAGDDFCG